MSSQVVPQGYNRTKVGVIPEDWDVVKLGNKFDFIKTYSNSRSHLSDDGDIEYMHYGDIHTKYKFHIDLNQVTLPKILETNIKGTIEYVKDGDLIIADASEDYADIGKSVEITNLGEKRVISGLHTFLLRDKDNNFADKYKGLLLYNQNVSKEIKKIATGISVLGISKTNLGKLLLPLPPIKEQQKIAQILTTWDDAIIKQESLIKAKVELKKGLMQKLLSGEVRFEGFAGEWKEIQLGDIASRITTKNTDNLIDMVFTNSAVNGIVIQNEFFDKDIANRDNLTGYYIVESGDFVYNPRISKHAPSGPINRNRHEFSGIVSPLYTVFRTNDNEIIDYLEYFFSSTLWFRYMKAIANYGARHDRMNITNNDFMKMPIPYPSKEEQHKIAEVLTLADKEIKLLKNELEALKEQKRGLMQRLLSGEVRVGV